MTGSAATLGRGLELVCVSRLKKGKLFVLVSWMFTRYPRSVLRHELSHSTHVATFKAWQRCTFSFWCRRECVVQAGRWPRQGRTGHALLREGVVVRHEAAQARPALASASSSERWDFPPARAGAPGRKSYRRGSLKFVRNLRGRSDDVRKAKVEYEADKYAKSAVESLLSRLW